MRVLKPEITAILKGDNIKGNIGFNGTKGNIGFNGTKTNCGIAHILGILLMNSILGNNNSLSVPFELNILL